MSFVPRQAAHCDQCSHEWLVVGASTPTHCAKCKSRRWNQSPPSSQLRNVAVQGKVNAERIHDKKTCRLYKCGMCADAN
jgi:hypothetical protein